MSTAPVSARKDSTNFIASTSPDVVLTPMGSSSVPVAYISSVSLDRSNRVSLDVFDNDLADFHLNARAQTSQGHEPGLDKGYKIPGYTGTAAAIESSASVAVNGYPVVRDSDRAMINRPDDGPQERQAPFTEETLEIRYG